MTVKMKHTRVKKGELHNEESRIQLVVQQMLVTRVFAACYMGRFYVEHLKSYRDVLRIQVEEKEIIRDLHSVRKRIFDFYKGAIWPAITGSDSNGTPSGDCVWVKLKKHLPLEKAHWFLIESVAICEEGELAIEIKDIRNVNGDVKSSPVHGDNDSIEWNKIRHNIINFLEEIITWHNTKECIRFVFVLLMTIATVMLNGLQYLGDYSICFFREFNNFIKVSTPTFLAIIDLIKKTIGGFFILITMMWRGSGRGPPPPAFLSQQGPYQRRVKY